MQGRIKNIQEGPFISEERFMIVLINGRIIIGNEDIESDLNRQTFLLHNSPYMVRYAT